MLKCRGQAHPPGATTLSLTTSTTHAAPADQPTSVREIAERLFPAYTVDGGSLHLAGCYLEDRVFVRVECCLGDRHVEIYVDQRGDPVDPALVEGLGMSKTIRLARPPETRRPVLSQATAGALRLAAERLPGEREPDLQGSTVLWCKFVRGKLRFVIGDRVEELPFSGWARLIEPPPFVCPHSGRRTYHLAATDDGRIVAADQIESCQETGCRMLADELVTCAATGRRVAAELAVTCPVTGDRVLENQMVRCGWCNELVSPTALERNQCSACRQFRPLDNNDSRLAQLVERYPSLRDWRKWQLSESTTVYVLTAAGLIRRLLAVVDKETLGLKLLATGSRLTSTWQPVDPAELKTLGG